MLNTLEIAVHISTLKVLRSPAGLFNLIEPRVSQTAATNSFLGHAY